MSRCVLILCDLQGLWAALVFVRSNASRPVPARLQYGSQKVRSVSLLRHPRLASTAGPGADRVLPLCGISYGSRAARHAADEVQF